MRVTLSQNAVKLITKLDALKRSAVQKAILKFVDNPRYPSLHFEKLSGHEDLWSIRSGRGDRLILRKLGDDHFEISDLGPHDVYLRMK